MIRCPQLPRPGRRPPGLQRSCWSFRGLSQCFCSFTSPLLGVCIPLSPFALRFLQSSVLGTLLSGCSAELIPRPLLLPLPRAFLLRTPCAWCPLPVPSL